MSRDYKAPAKKKSNGKGSPLFVGLLIGLLFGVAISVALIIYIKSSGSPFNDNSKSLSKGDTVDSKSNNTDIEKPTTVKKTDKPEAVGKPRFDFYTILPGSETAVSEQEIKKNELQADAAKIKDSYYLQVGAFQTEQEADNMKAKLALLGIESLIQTANVPDKGIWHRVRVGPFSDVSQIDKAKTDLSQNGFKADLIKVKTDTQNQ